MGFGKVLYLLTLYITYGVMEDIKDLNFNELLRLTTNVQQVRFGDVKSNDVTFYLITRSSPKKLITSETDLNVTKPTKFLIHGYVENNRRTWYQTLTKQFLNQGDFNVIQVDWEKPARSSYVSAAPNTKLVGNLVGQFVTDKKIPLKNIHIIGVSLGAHVAGFAAKYIKGKEGNKIYRISGLDPAGPYFRQFQFNPNARLDKEDARIVDAIHTDAGRYGINYPVGTLDIIVNGGYGPQPGCLDNLNVKSFGGFTESSFCSHARSVYYFMDWVNNGKFHCKMCKLTGSFLVGNCKEELILGEEDVNKEIKGICITRTASQEPFLK